MRYRELDKQLPNVDWRLPIEVSIGDWGSKDSRLMTGLRIGE
jgi:hypothetical protein